MGQPDEIAAARNTLARHISLAIRAAQMDHPTPALLATEAPSVLAIMAGSYLLQLTRSQVLGDGEGDKALAGMVRDMHRAADPSLNARTGGEIPARVGRKLREWMKGAARG